MPRTRVTTIIWDFDGTLADTLARNLEITREIAERLTGRSAGRIAALRSVAAYGEAIHAATNWRQLYVDEFGIPRERGPEAAKLWTELHGQDREPPALFDGVAEVIRRLSNRRQGIVSQNGRDNIRRALEPLGLLAYFDSIVADEDLPFDRQKPQPDGLLHCAEALHAERSNGAPEIVLYVGDHPVDVECVRRAASELESRGSRWRVLSVGAVYGDAAPHRWTHQPDLTAERAEDLIDLVADLDG